MQLFIHRMLWWNKFTDNVKFSFSVNISNYYDVHVWFFWNISALPAAPAVIIKINCFRITNGCSTRYWAWNQSTRCQLFVYSVSLHSHTTHKSLCNFSYKHETYYTVCIYHKGHRLGATSYLTYDDLCVQVYTKLM